MAATYDGTIIPLRPRHAFVVIMLMMVTLLALGGRLVHIRAKHGARLASIVERQRLVRAPIAARRGFILDRRGRVVASSQVVRDVFVDPALIRNLDRLDGELCVRLDLEPGYVANCVAKRPHSRFIVVAKGVDEVAMAAVTELNNPAVGISRRFRRAYPLGESMAHVLGIVGRDGDGQEGLELTLNKHLTGKDGQRVGMRDARRRALWRVADQARPPIDGGHAVLTIDAEIQRIAEDALADTMQQTEAESAISIVIEPSTGELLAMALAPSFDPNEYNLVSPDVRRNRALTDPTEPGSTFKPFIAGAALEMGAVSITERIDCEMGTYRIGRRLVRDVSPHGEMSILEIVSKSSNIGMAKVAERMGPDAIFDAMQRFGFGSKAGIECPGESSGLMYPLKRWTSMSATSISFGYEIGVTPLQLITAFAAIVNDGVLLKPGIVKELIDARGGVVESFPHPQIKRRAMSTEVARYMTEEVLRAVVADGSGFRAEMGTYPVIGKTGTAKLPYRDKPGYEPGAYVSTFIGAAPAGDPRICVLVMVRRPNPAGGYYGGVIAAPPAGRIMHQTLAYLDQSPAHTPSINTFVADSNSRR